ncbi:MAG: SLC13 family permease [Promethearchaeota archaeon]
MNLALLIFVFALFIIILISYAIKDFDFVAISLFCSFIAAMTTGVILGLNFDDFIEYIEFQVIIIILSMSIITKIARDSQILEFLAIKLFKLAKGDERVFFYLICIIATLLAAIISDVVVVLILAPIIVKLCKILKTQAGTYLLGMTICINIGSIITPFSSGENIMISTYFKLDTLYFIENYWIFSFFLLFITIFLIDQLILSKEPKVEYERKLMLVDFLDEKFLISNKAMFYFNSIAIILTIILFAIFPSILYFIAAISALTLVIVNKSHTKKKMRDLLSEIEWEIIFFFISLYIVIGCLLEAGFREIFENIPFERFDTFTLSLMILLIVSLVSGFVANTPTALAFIPIIDILISDHGFPAIPLLFGFIIGINLGGNIIPQGAACDVMTLKIAEHENVKNLTYKRLLKVGCAFAVLHIILSIGYLFLLVLIMG